MKLEQDISKEFPLHYHVWKNDCKTLGSLVTQQTAQQLELLDPRGRSPLMLAVTLGYVECARVLVNHGASVNVENAEGWTVVQEASASGDPKLLQLVLEKRDHQRHNSRMLAIPALLQKLKEAPDFYMEMKWEFTSWLPLVSRLCPSDTYKVYKQGSNVRIDTTLLGFDQNSWQRGNKSFLFKGDTEEKAILMEMDHDTKEVYVEELHTISEEEERSRQVMAPSDHAVTVRLTTPIVHTYVDTDKIAFERNKCGIWGWRSDKTELVNGRESKVFSATNVELVTKTRTEHLSYEDKAANRSRNQRFPLQSLLGVAQLNAEDPNSAEEVSQESSSSVSGGQVTMLEYFDSSVNLGDRDIGRPKEMTTKVQKFKATLWLCEDFPLSLAEQIMPIVDLMAISSSHFAKLKDFIQMQMPAGFPIKIEIPLFHVMNACVTFGNVFGTDEDVVGVSSIQEVDRLSCVVDDCCFEAPSDYVVFGLASAANIRRQFSMDEDDELLQYAIQQSLVDAGTENDQVDIWEALKVQKPLRPVTPQPLAASRSPLPPRPSSVMGVNITAEEEQLQRAIAASLEMYGSNSDPVVTATSFRCDAEPNVDRVLSSPGTVEEVALAEVLALSVRESELEKRRRREEDEILQRILELSMVEK